MFRSDAVATRGNPIVGALKAAAPALAMAFGLAIAADGHATAYYLNSLSMDTSHIADIQEPGGSHEYAYIGPVVFHANEGTTAATPTYDLLAFCVDIFHNISLGDTGLKYDDDYDLATDNKYQDNAHPFTGANTLLDIQIEQVGRLVNYGRLVYDGEAATADRSNKLAGLQGAIWQVMNGPAYTVVAWDAPVQSYITDFSSAGYLAHLSGHGVVGSKITMITETGKYGLADARQSFAFAVPEPATWALMITGFGFAGAMLRRDRRRLATVKI